MQWVPRILAVNLAIGLLGVSLVSHAALFDDTEARKKS